MTDMTNGCHRADAWVLTNGQAGFENPCLGVAAAMGLAPQLKRINPRRPWRWLAPFGPPAPTTAAAAPWPDFLIASGRQAIPYARAIGRRSPRTFTAVLQNPRVDPAHFDIVWAPAHDRLSGPNVISTALSPHHLTPALLAEAAALWETRVAHLPRPRVAVLIGGPSRAHAMNPAAVDALAHALARAAREQGAGLMVTPSRRTGADNTARLRAHLADLPALVWDGAPPNPYAGFLGLADAIIVTGDSVNMASEAVSTGRPVQVYDLPARRSAARLVRFHDALRDLDAARPFSGRLEIWPCQPLNATLEIAEAFRAAWKNRTIP